MASISLLPADRLPEELSTPSKPCPSLKGYVHTLAGRSYPSMAGISHVWPYQAIVMKILETHSSNTVLMQIDPLS